MCGICGIWRESNPTRVERMITAMRHRGPDDAGIFQEEGIVLGMARLSILDLTPSGHQPMSTPDGLIWIVYNGETYNFREEREILVKKGYSFKSTSDTEVVLRMYEAYDDDFLLRMRGMFALAIYDKRRGLGQERLLLARDHLGIKPLLYAQRGKQIVFASELKTLLASGLIEPAIDAEALRLLLTFGSVYQPHTMLRGVNMLLPAHRMIIEHNRTRIERYWSLEVDRQVELRKQPYEELVEIVTEKLRESIRLQLVSDVPLGAFLSGGVDSSVLVAMMAQEIGHHVKTFSVGFEAEGSHIDESEDARRTARFLGTDHTHVLVTGNDVRERIRHIASSLDQPSVDGVNSYFVSLAARQGVTVAISGTGGDEIYAGYPWFIQMYLDEMYQKYRSRSKRFAKALFAAIARHTLFDPLLLRRGGGRLDHVRNHNGFVSKYSNLYKIFGSLHTARLLAPELRYEARAGRATHHDVSPIDELSNGSPIERVSGLCLRGYTNNQLLRDIDAVSMSHSLEVRVPYLDWKVVDNALSLPNLAKLNKMANLDQLTQQTYRETGAKQILLDIARPLLPKDFDLQPKRGFAMPFDAWLRGPLREVLLDTLSERQIRQRGLLALQETLKVRDSFFEGSAPWTWPWLLMMLELWCREVLDNITHEKAEL